MSQRAWDAAIGASLVAATLLYLAFWPLDFYPYDEGVLLYEAKRVLGGEVMYRDFFEIITPGSFYLMSALYALFGVTLQTARSAMAVIHALIVLLVFIICRRLGVRQGLAVLAALAHLTLGYPACSIASAHWISTCLTLALLLLVLDRPATTRTRAFAWGVTVGLLTLNQHQKGALMAGAVGVVLLFDGAQARLRPLAMLRRAGWCLGSFLIVVMPVILAFVSMAGLENVWRALILQPFVSYPKTSHSKGSFGQYIPGVHPAGFIIKWVPLMLPAAIALLISRWRASPDRNLLVATAFAAGALLSIAYNPNYVHLTFAAPVWFSLAALLIEALLAAASGRARWLPPAARGLTLLVIVLACIQLGESLRARHRLFPFRVETAFGSVDSAFPSQGAFMDWLRDHFRRERVTQVFAYPTNPGFYLLTGTENPTRYQIVVPGYTSDDQIDEIIGTLEQRQVPFVVVNLYPMSGGLERLNAYVHRYYVPVALPSGLAANRLALLTVYRRKPGASPFGAAQQF